MFNAVPLKLEIDHLGVTQGQRTDICGQSADTVEGTRSEQGDKDGRRGNDGNTSPSKGWQLKARQAQWAGHPHVPLAAGKFSRRKGQSQ